MKKTQVIIISLLVVAIVFSIVSMAVNFTMDDFDEIKLNEDVPVSGGQVNVDVLPTPQNTGVGVPE